jgi:UDP-glucose 4-epimerase
MKIFVTGGSGFIGSHVVKQLLERGENQVTVFDMKRPTGLKVDFIEGDIMNADQVTRAMKGHDAVLHLAAMLGVIACQQDESMVHTVNVQGMQHVLSAMAQNGIKRFLFASSSEVYGDGVAERFREVDPLHPKSAYGRSKVEGEHLAEEYARRHGATVTVTRFFNVYGPGQREDFVMMRFCRSALAAEPIHVYGNGTQTRTFTYIEDAAKGAVSAFLAPQASPFEIFNIGSGETVTIAALGKRIKEIANSVSPVEIVPLTEAQTGRNVRHEIFHRIPDTSKAAEHFSFVAETPLKEGIKRTLDFCLANGGASPMAFLAQEHQAPRAAAGQRS